MMNYDTNLTNNQQFSFPGLEEEQTYENSPGLLNLLPLTSHLTPGGYNDPYSNTFSNEQKQKTKVVRSKLLEPQGYAKSVNSIKKKAIPPINSFGKAGKIFCRTSPCALLLRRWTESYWLHVHPTTILLFKSKKDMEKWKALESESEVHGEEGRFTSGHKKKEKLIHWSINFDTSGIVHNKMIKAERKKCKRMNIPPPKSKSKVNDNTLPPILYAMEEVRSKYYDGRKGPLFHSCKISYLSTSGRTLAAAFGSSEPSELKTLRATVRYCLKLVTKYTKKRGRREHGIVGGTVDSGGTLLSGVGYSAVASEFSSTVYGRQTMTESTLGFAERNE